MFQILSGNNNPILRRESEEIRGDELEKYASLAKQMLRFVSDDRNGSVGLAAPQIGVNKQLICVRLLRNYEDENGKTICLFNPKIVRKSAEKNSDTEGCLSLPGQESDVWRYDEIDVEYMDAKGRKNKLRASQLSARILQHEIDHLHGILFTDYNTNNPLLF